RSISAPTVRRSARSTITSTFPREAAMSTLKREIVITQAKIDLYGKINGDNDIIHYDHDYALKRGFRGTLVHGPHLSAFVGDLAVKKYGKDWFYRGRMETKWVAPVCPGDTLLVELHDDGTVSESVAAGVPGVAALASTTSSRWAERINSSLKTLPLASILTARRWRSAMRSSASSPS